MNYSVMYQDRHIDNQMQSFNTIEEAIKEAEAWIISRGYKVYEWSKFSKAKCNKDLTAVTTWIHPCESDRVMIFKIKQKGEV